MAQLSGSWTTTVGGAGDQQVSYTQAQWSTAYKVIAGCSGFEGVAPGLADSLICAANGAGTVSVGTGGAMVDGKWFYNDASANVAITWAAGGNTRIDRIVLRCSWAGFTVAITKIEGTDTALPTAPTAPAITQTTGTTYDIMLCQVLVNAAGAVTVTDERVWALPGGLSGISVLGRQASGLGKMAPIVSASDGQVLQRAAGLVVWGAIPADSVGAAAVGTMVPAVLGRQGGSATEWDTAGTTNYATGLNVRVQCGAIAASAPGTAITFPVAFSAKPVVLLTSTNIKGLSVATVIAATGCTIASYDVSDYPNGVSQTVQWLAIGPE